MGSSIMCLGAWPGLSVALSVRTECDDIEKVVMPGHAPCTPTGHLESAHLNKMSLLLQQGTINRNKLSLGLNSPSTFLLIYFIFFSQFCKKNTPNSLCWDARIILYFNSSSTLCAEPCVCECRCIFHSCWRKWSFLKSWFCAQVEFIFLLCWWDKACSASAHHLKLNMHTFAVIIISIYKLQKRH